MADVVDEPMNVQDAPANEAMDVPVGDMNVQDDTGLNIDEADDVGKDIQITADGGVMKKILVKGSGWDKPGTGDIVSVHYVGTLTDGTKFDSSRDRNEPFTFNLGEGRVIKGWDLGVATMRRGEKAVLTCMADYAYGASGSPPKIPPGATLNFEVELLSWTSLKDISGDGGVIKTTVQEGTGWSKPDDRDEAKVIYTARVQGASEPFLTSGPEGVEFVVFEGLQGMRGVTTAVKAMKKGETANVILAPEYAYGSQGREGVPPGSHVELDLQLVSWKKVEDVTSDGAVIKKTLEESTEWKRPNEGAKVTVRVTGRLEDGSVFLSHPEGAELTFVTDEGQVPEGLDQALLKMKVQEKALIVVPPAYGYGDAGKPLDATPAEGGVGQVAAVPGGATVTYEVELVSTENAKESWEMGDDEKVAEAKVKKEKANQAYREGRTQRAIALYDKAVSLVSSDNTFSDELKALAKELRRSLHLNLAAAHIKQSNWKQAAAQAGKVLELDPTSVKALYRRAQAHLGSGDYVEAEQDLKRGLAEEPNNADMSALHRKLKVLMRDQAKKEASLYSRMFKAPKAAPTPAPAPAPPGSQGTPGAAGGQEEGSDVAATMDVGPDAVQAS